MAKVEVVKAKVKYQPVRLTLETVEEFSVIWCLLGLCDSKIKEEVAADYKGNADNLLKAAEEIWNKMEYVAKKEDINRGGE